MWCGTTWCSRSFARTKNTAFRIRSAAETARRKARRNHPERLGRLGRPLPRVDEAAATRLFTPAPRECDRKSPTGGARRVAKPGRVLRKCFVALAPGEWLR